MERDCVIFVTKQKNITSITKRSYICLRVSFIILKTNIICFNTVGGLAVYLQTLWYCRVIKILPACIMFIDIRLMVIIINSVGIICCSRYKSAVNAKFHFWKFNALFNLTLFNNDKSINAIVFHSNLKTGVYIECTTLKNK